MSSSPSSSKQATKSSPSKGSRGRGQIAGSVSARPPPAKRRFVPPIEADQEHNMDEDMDILDKDEDPSDSGGSVYRSDQYRAFLANAPLLHNHAPTSIVDINLGHYDPVLNAMYNTFYHTCYASSASFMPITRAQFLRVSKLCLKARLDFVYMRSIGPVPQDRVNINQAPDMPKCLAEIVNGIGLVAAWDTNLIVSPRSMVEVVDANERVHRTPANVINNFRLLVQNLVRKGFTSSVPISRADEGTCYWLLQARDQRIEPVATARGDAQVVTCRSQIDTTTPADIMLSAIVQNGFDGNIPPFNFYLYESDQISGIPTLRTSFFLSK